jgi:NAD(P)-dependent dehydrogenase (short-subunit alcohol dehydrogenase family)
MIARGHRGLEAAKRQVESAGGHGLTFPADVADPDALAACGEKIITEWGRIDVWINNAMATVFAPAEAITPAEFKRVTEVTYLGQVHGTLEALRHMRRQGGGTIVQVGSALAYRSIPLQSAYCGAKAAVRGFTDSLRSELIHEGSPVRLTMVHLPAINTPQFEWARSRLPRSPQPVPPIHTPEVAAEAIFRAAIEAPRELWVGAPTMEAILGTMAAPGVLDRMMASRAWDGQMTDEPARGRPDNLFEPVDRGFGAEGRFAREAKPRALTLSAALVRGVAAAATAGVAAGLLALAWNGGQRAAKREPFLPDRIQRGRQEEAT